MCKSLQASSNRNANLIEFLRKPHITRDIYPMLGRSNVSCLLLCSYLRVFSPLQGEMLLPSICTLKPLEDHGTPTLGQYSGHGKGIQRRLLALVGDTA